MEMSATQWHPAMRGDSVDCTSLCACEQPVIALTYNGNAACANCRRPAVFIASPAFLPASDADVTAEG